MIDYLLEANALKEELYSLRESFHREPELGRHEFQTSEKIREYLDKLGYQIESVGPTGLLATLNCGEGEKVAFRSDIDALPIDEKSGAPFASEHEGVMHACGHDIHMTSLLGCAKILAHHKDEIHGTIKLIFEMDEEGDGGAKEFEESGLLDDVSCVFGQHVSPDIPFGTIGYKDDRFYASACTFDITVHGQSTHAATPENGIDALYGGSMIVNQLKNLTGLYEGNKAVVSIGSFHSGTVRNIISDVAKISGIIRTQGTDIREKVKERFYKIIQQVISCTGVRCEVDLKDGYPGVINHHDEVMFVKEKAVELIGNESVIEIKDATMTTEDFGTYIEHRKGCFYHLGVGGNASLHNDHFCPDSSITILGSALSAKILVEYLNEKHSS